MSSNPDGFKTLSQKKLILVSGKGGVGKTTLSAALALALSHTGRRVLLTEIDTQGQMAQLFDRKDIGYTPVALNADLQVMNIIPKKSFEEYVVLQLKFQSVYKIMFDNKYVRAFLDGTPGLSELMSIGKIYAMINDYDTIVVDAPATGHGVSLLQIPTIVAQAVRVGPLRTHSQNIEALLKDKTRTAVVLVTLPEEMPIAETLEFQSWIHTNLGVPLAQVYLNGIYEPLLSEIEAQHCNRFFRAHMQNEKLQGVRQSWELYQQRVGAHSHYKHILEEELNDCPLSSIPYLFCDQIGVDELAQLSRLLQQS